MFSDKDISSHIKLPEKYLLFVGQRNYYKNFTLLLKAFAMLNTVYSKALAFIFPSEYEGFGIPVLEAFENECPVILSNSSCFPEIAQNAALYFENGNANDLAGDIINLINQPDLREQLISSGKKRAFNFSWEKTVEQTGKLYSRIVNHAAADSVEFSHF